MNTKEKTTSQTLRYRNILVGKDAMSFSDYYLTVALTSYCFILHSVTHALSKMKIN